MQITRGENDKHNSSPRYNLKANVSCAQNTKRKQHNKQPKEQEIQREQISRANKHILEQDRKTSSSAVYKNKPQTHNGL